MTNSNEQIPLGEQRKRLRRLYLKSVTIHANDHTCSGMIQNISGDGVYIEANGSFSIGQKITISYLVSNSTDGIEIPGEVVWTDQNGFAMKYI